MTHLPAYILSDGTIDVREQLAGTDPRESFGESERHDHKRIVFVDDVEWKEKREQGRIVKGRKTGNEKLTGLPIISLDVRVIEDTTPELILP